jgi:hypothetical protein
MERWMIYAAFVTGCVAACVAAYYRSTRDRRAFEKFIRDVRRHHDHPS